MRSLSILLTILLFFIFAGFAEANGLGGTRLEKVEGEYMLDVGTDHFGEPVPNTRVQFDFNLLRADTREYISFDYVTFTVLDSRGKVLEDRRLEESASGFTVINYYFPKAGRYDLRVNIYKEGKLAVGAVFPITVPRPPLSFKFGTPEFNITAGAAVAGIAALYYYLRNRRKGA